MINVKVLIHKFSLPVLFMICFGFFAVAGRSEAAITLNNGYWSTSFVGIPTGDVGYGDVSGGLTADDPAYACSGTQHSQILTAANYPMGEGGGGWRTYFNGDSRNEMSTGAAIYFPVNTTDFWLRFYYKFPLGQTFGGIKEHKIIYLFNNGGTSANVCFPQGDNDIALQPRNTMGSPDIYFSGGGWQTINSNSVISDDSWHYYEFHFGLGTSGGNDGVFQMWVDGINRANRTDLDWFNGGTANPTGWSRVYIPSNHNVMTLAGCNGNDLDDIAVATPTYAGFIQDARGQDMIGPVNAGDVTPPSSPQGLAVQ